MINNFSIKKKLGLRIIGFFGYGYGIMNFLNWWLLMLNGYLWLLTAHLLSAVIFAGAVIFEVLIIESLHRHLSYKVMMQIERAIILRARRIMPLVVLVLFTTGLGLFFMRVPEPSLLWQSRFGQLLSVKIFFALVVLVCFITALTLFARGAMTPRIFTLIHRLVFIAVITIIILAKLMLWV